MYPLGQMVITRTGLPRTVVSHTYTPTLKKVGTRWPWDDPGPSPGRSFGSGAPSCFQSLREGIGRYVEDRGPGRQMLVWGSPITILICKGWGHNRAGFGQFPWHRHLNAVMEQQSLSPSTQDHWTPVAMACLPTAMRTFSSTAVEVTKRRHDRDS